MKDVIEKLKKLSEDLGEKNVLCDEVMIRELIADEYNAVRKYKDFAAKSVDPETSKVFMDIAREEEVHIGELEFYLENMLNKHHQTTMETRREGAKEITKLLNEGKIHADSKEELRPLKDDETIVYGGAMFHIVKKDSIKEDLLPSDNVKTDLDKLEDHIVYCSNNGIRIKNKLINNLYMLVTNLRYDKNLAYHERDMVVAGLSKIFPSYLSKQDESSIEDLNNIVYINIPGQGQVSWHIKNNELPLFNHLQYKENCWDGHDTFEKYRRLLSYEQGINRYLDP